MQDLKIKIYKSFDSTLKKEWDEFEINSENYCFQNFYWLNNWYDKYKINQLIKPFVIIVYKNEKVISILPFVIHKLKFIRILKWMGGEHSDYMGGLFSKKFDLEKKEFIFLWKMIKKELPYFDIFHFYNQPEQIGNIENPFIKYLDSVKTGYSSGVKIENNFENYIQNNLKKKFLSDTKRSFNHLASKGNLKFKIYNNKNIKEKTDFIEKILEQKILRLRHLKIKNNFTENIKKFYTEFNNDLFKYGYLHLSSLELDGKILASHWGIVYKDVFYYLLPSITKNDLMKFSPGRLLLYNLIKWGYENKIKKFDLTLGEESYKKEWTNSKINLSEFYGPKSLIGYPISFFFLIKLKIKNILKNILRIRN